MFDLIAPGDRGPAVEDVQKRLLVLGHDLGPTGIDGVFLGATHAAVRRFQAEHHLTEDGVIGEETWAALVDATFTLGDRLLYLRLPYFHGADVRRLQGALNVLGFACGGPDGIFGAFTERALREFQANVGLPADGIAGQDTVRMIERLGHVWEGKDPTAPASLALGSARASEALRDVGLVLVACDPSGRAVAERVANLVGASEAGASVTIGDATGAGSAPLETDGAGNRIVLRFTSEAASFPVGLPVIVVAADTSLEGRFIAATGASPALREVVVVVPVGVIDAEHDAQACAVHVLDGLCGALSGVGRPVIP